MKDEEEELLGDDDHYNKSIYLNPSHTNSTSRSIKLLSSFFIILFSFIIGFSSSTFLTTSSTIDLIDSSCNPYHLPGITIVSDTDPAGNRWELINGIPKHCPPSMMDIDYLTKIIEIQTNKSLIDDDSLIGFAKDRTVVMVGDSVDRLNLIHFCSIVKGKLETIKRDSPFSPSPPLNQSHPLPGYKTSKDQDGGIDGEWNDNEQSRPHTCFVESINFRLVSIFFFGFQEEDDIIQRHGHFYPPLKVEDRIDLILLPLLNKILPGKVPENIVLTAGFVDYY